jgi:peroxiredoxin
VIEPGTKAPDFTLKNHRGEEMSLSDLRGRPVVLCFYPNDFSPVCTDQLSLYNNRKDELDDARAELIGISVDHSWAHRAFHKQLGIDFTLLADFHPKGAVAGAYGAYLEAYGTANRSLVLIDEEGTVAWVHEADTPLEIPPAELILEALERRR